MFSYLDEAGGGERMSLNNKKEVCGCGHEKRHHVIINGDNRYDGRCQCRKGNKYFDNAMCGCDKFKERAGEELI